jgi:hypothetical protein
MLLWNRLFWFNFFPCSGMTPKGQTVQGEKVFLKLGIWRVFPKYIVGPLKPIISRIEETNDPNNQKTDHRGVVDLLLFDGASNVKNAGTLASSTYPRITVVHGAEHVVSLFFKDIFTKMPVFLCLSQFLKRCRNIFGSTVTILMHL